MMEGRTSKVVYLRADERLRYGSVIEVVDTIKKAGVEQIGFVYVLPAGEGGPMNDAVDRVARAASGAGPRASGGPRRVHRRARGVPRVAPSCAAWLGAQGAADPARCSTASRCRCPAAAAGRSAAASPRPSPRRRRAAGTPPEPPRQARAAAEGREAAEGGAAARRRCPTLDAKKTTTPEARGHTPRGRHPAPTRRGAAAAGAARHDRPRRRASSSARAGARRARRHRSQRRLVPGRRAAEDLDDLDAADQDGVRAARSPCASPSSPTGRGRRRARRRRRSGVHPARHWPPSARSTRPRPSARYPRHYGTNRLTIQAVFKPTP